ncbi:glycosyltransferase [Roseovarius aestuarii]|nr:glycosyltransferase [Roseovarius aestuarii]
MKRIERNQTWQGMMIANGPNLYVLGAPRAGSTYLFSALAQSPEVFVPPVEEPHFHLRDHWRLNGPEHDAFTKPLCRYLNGKAKSAWGGMITEEKTYRQLYVQGATAKFRMDGTPNYFREADLIAHNVDSFVDETVFAIAIVRDPVERILSHYRLFRQLGWETLEFEEAILAGPERVARGWAGTWDYVRYSEFSKPSEHWARVLGDRFRLVSYHDLSIAPRDVMSDLADWLGIHAGEELPKDKFNSAARFDDMTRSQAESIISKTGRIALDQERDMVENARNSKLTAPLVSVGMPVRNGAKSIGTAIASLQAQTYRNIKIVVADNASTDQSAQIVRKIAASDNRVILQSFDEYVDIKNSFERAAKTCDGDYFLFAPADDTWAPDFIEMAVGRLQGNPNAAVCCGSIELYDDAGHTWPCNGLKAVQGPQSKRWRRALLQMDASRIYGLIRSSALVDLFPDDDPEGWDHFSAAKLAWHGDIEIIDMTVMSRHQTPIEYYRAKMFDQERTFWGQVFFMRHVARLFRIDPDIDTTSFGARMALWGFVLVHVNLALRGRGRAFSLLRWPLKRLGKACVVIARLCR